MRETGSIGSRVETVTISAGLRYAVYKNKSGFDSLIPETEQERMSYIHLMSMYNYSQLHPWITHCSKRTTAPASHQQRQDSSSRGP